MSRSPAVVAAGIAIIENREPGVALKFVTAQHPADVVPGFWEEICQVVETLQDEEDD